MATVFAAATAIIVVLWRKVGTLETEVRTVRDQGAARELAANERYIGLLNSMLAGLAGQTEALRRVTETLDALREAMRLEERVTEVSGKVAAALDRLPRGGPGG
jgi:hypothetical protein